MKVSAKALGALAAVGGVMLLAAKPARAASSAPPLTPARSPSPSPSPSPKPAPSPQPGGEIMPHTLEAQLVKPADGWTGGRAIIDRELVSSTRWLESPERAGEVVTTDRTTLRHWTMRDEVTVAVWLPKGELSVPGWIDVDLTHLHEDGSSDTLTVTVSSDAVALADLRVRCSILAAQCIADAFDAMLPTFGIVDAAWAASNRLAAHPLVPSPVPTSRMRSIAAWLIEDDLTGPVSASLTRTTGKEYVMHPGLVQRPNSGTMYGWQLKTGQVIQSPKDGASFAHEATYFDYSQVTTLVRRQAKLNGQLVELASIYQTRPELVMGGRKTGPVPIRHPLVPAAA